MTQRDIVDNYILSMDNCSFDYEGEAFGHYELDDNGYAIAQILSGNLPERSSDLEETAPDEYKKLLQNTIYQQVYKDYILIERIKMMSVRTIDIQDIKKHIVNLLEKGADPNALGYYDQSSIRTAFEMSLWEGHITTILDLLCYGGSLEAIIDHGTFDALEDEHVKKYILYCFWIEALNTFPILYGVTKKEHIINKVCKPLIQDSDLSGRLSQFDYLLTSMLSKIYEKDDIRLNSNESIVKAFYIIFSGGHAFDLVLKNMGVKKCQHYVIRYPKAAERLFLHSPYRMISSTAKESHEKYLIQLMQQQKKESGISQYHGFLMLEDHRLLHQYKKRNFTDIVFE